MDSVSVDLLAQARGLSLAGQDVAAREAYCALIHRTPTDVIALGEFAVLAARGGYRAAARTAYEQALRFHPSGAALRVNLGQLLLAEQDAEAAIRQFEAALAVAPGLAEAHQGLARGLTALGREREAEPHWRAGFTGHAVVSQRFRGVGPGIAMLLLVSAREGNIPTRALIDDTIFAVTAIYAEYHDPSEVLPPHALVFNAIGDADLCAPALAVASTLLAKSIVPIINVPEAVARTGRAANAARLGGIPDVVAPRIRTIRRQTLLDGQGGGFPLLLRAAGFHTGQHFVRVEDHGEIETAIATLPGDDLLAIEWLDARGADGLARKYRVMVVDGTLYPLHLAVSTQWKVHYVTADMAENGVHRAEEQRFLEDMPGVLGVRAMQALERIAQALGLDYGGIDFGLSPAGAVLLFEANATMVINPPGPELIWEYRRAPITRVLEAARAMLLARGSPHSSLVNSSVRKIPQRMVCA